jgi:hypothetical protein
MNKKINIYEFVNDFKKSQYKNNFSIQGLRALFDYFEKLEEDLGEELEFDIIAICCDYTEYDTIEEFKKDYAEFDNIKSIKEIEEDTVVIRIKGTNGIIVKNF